MVHILAQFMQSPRIYHWVTALHVVRCLKGSPGQGILLRVDSLLILTAYYDSNWATCSITRRSVTGYFISLDGSLISWKTKKQLTVSYSSAEAEYCSMVATLCELKWLYFLLKDLRVFVHYSILLHCDNQTAINIVATLIFHECMKNIEIDCHFISDAFHKGFITPSYIQNAL